MAYTNEEERNEFWMLTKGILQDSKVDIEEAKVLKRWMEEHPHEGFQRPISKLEKFMADGYIDRFESKELIESISFALRTLRQ